ncbi:MAG TPA: EamA family transporter [Candidatus Binatia bacterium]
MSGAGNEERGMTPNGPDKAVITRPPLASYLLLFLPPVFWSSNFIVGKALVGKVPPWTLNAGRFAVAALILLPLLVYRKEWPPRKTWLPLLLMSLTGVFAFNAVLYIGLRYTSAINATLVNATTPITTTLIARLLIREEITRRRVVGIALSFAGIGWIVGRGSLAALAGLDFNPGDVIVFCATSLWGFYMVMAKPMMRRMSPLTLTSVTTVVGAAFLIPAAALELHSHPVDLLQTEIILAILYLGIFPSFLSFLLWNRSIRIFGPSRASLAYNTLPLFAVVLSEIFLGEPLKGYQIAGGIVIIAGVIIGTRD